MKIEIDTKTTSLKYLEKREPKATDHKEQSSG